MQYIKIERADVPNLPEATRVSTRPALWEIKGQQGRFAIVNAWCLYENLSSSYLEICDRCNGLPVQDGWVVARNGRRAYLFSRR